MGFPEGSNMKAPGDSEIPLGALFPVFHELSILYKKQPNRQSKKGERP